MEYDQFCVISDSARGPSSSSWSVSYQSQTRENVTLTLWRWQATGSTVATNISSRDERSRWINKSIINFSIPLCCLCSHEINLSQRCCCTSAPHLILQCLCKCNIFVYTSQNMLDLTFTSRSCLGISHLFSLSWITADWCWVKRWVHQLLRQRVFSRGLCHQTPV